MEQDNLEDEEEEYMIDKLILVTSKDYAERDRVKDFLLKSFGEKAFEEIDVSTEEGKVKAKELGVGEEPGIFALVQGDIIKCDITKDEGEDVLACG
jgi:hypothetical protein